MPTTLEKSIQQLIDLEEIRKLKHRYMKYCDDHYNPDAIADLFVEDGSWEGGAFGSARGRDNIRSFFQHNARQVQYAVHFTGNEIIDVHGDTATGEWYLWQPMVLSDSSQALWLAGKYSDIYTRSDDRWLYKSLRLEVEMFSPYESGFGKIPFAGLPEK